jgi:hypothetical protein
MGIRDRAIADARRISSNKTGGAGVDMRFVSNPRRGSYDVTIVGLHTRHHLSFSTEGAITNDLNAHCSFSESLLASAGYPVRNGQNQVDIKDDLIYIDDSQGVNRKYKIAQAHPDETIGFIRCILQDCG